MRWRIALLVGLAGCLPVDGPGTEGELGHGSFAYACDASGDRACVTTSGPDIPRAVAVGADFTLNYAGATPSEGGVGFQVRVVPASSLVVETAPDGSFTVQEPGPAAFLARGTNGEVADMVHVVAGALATLDVSGSAGLGVETVVLQAPTGGGPGLPETLAPVPLDEDGETLDGALAYAWSSSDEAVVLVSTQDGSALLTPVAAGTATVAVAVGTVRREIAVTVEGGAE